MDLFEKCYNFEEADQAKAMHLYPYFQPIETEQGTEVSIDGKKLLMLGSNSYLGLTTDERVKQASIEAIRKYGTGNAGSRFLNGTLDLHVELEEKLAEFVGKEAALLFSTGFQANLAISALVEKNDVVIIDKSDHASIIDGTRLSFGKVKRFRHNDMNSLESVIKRLDSQAGKFVVVDGVFSMEGDIVNLPKLVDLRERYGFRIMVDDAHALGVIGKNGSGTADYFGLTAPTDIIMGTFSKSFASLGGFLASNKKVIDYLKHHARSLIFSASITPAATAAVLKALEIMKSEPERIEKLWENTTFMRKGLDDLGFNTGNSTTPIIPVVAGDTMRTLRMWRTLFDSGLFVNPVLPPAVPLNEGLIRVSLMATHTKEQLKIALEKFEQAGKQIGIIDRLETGF
ncbi:MAG: aminotransferase class I/II-fold pyridoxal phosphate-dependent enzyme [Epsilonproteobacteria bacterium]|nr:aminotransferase class I/II-fold pyridoxal phosphate-dependent enzyme [Campylobacterota bacterium]